jgi:transitional endoplasmic reticulum ATPase
MASTRKDYADMAAEVERLALALKPKSPQDELRDKILGQLDALGTENLNDEMIVWEGNRFQLPVAMEGNLPAVVEYLTEVMRNEETTYEMTFNFRYRPWDGAAAFVRAMKRVFGTTGIGKGTQTFFGRRPPQLITISTGPHENMQVPWGKVGFAPLEATFILEGDFGENEEDGVIFQIHVEAPRKHRKRIDGFMKVVKDELDRNSIYRGKAITAQENPQFLDLSVIDPNKIVYAAETLRQLDANVWTVLNHAGTLRSQGIPLKRAVLVEGPYGSGKTLAGARTGQVAVANGWTYILVRKNDDPYKALQTARLYGPAVVWIEDLDMLSVGKTRDAITGLLDALDGVQAKGQEVMAGFTTNFPEKIDRGVLRPGRIDAVINVGALDADGYEKLVQVTLQPELLGRINYAEVSRSFGKVGDEPGDEAMLPAFAVEAIQRSVRYGLARNKGKLSKVETVDLVDAANGLRPQLKMVALAEEAGHATPTMEGLFTEAMESTINRSQVAGVAPLQVAEKKKAA